MLVSSHLAADEIIEGSRRASFGPPTVFRSYSLRSYIVSRGTKKLNTAQSTLVKFMAVPVLKIYPGGKLRTDD